MSDPLDDHGDALAAADAHAGEAELDVALLHLVEEGDQDAGAAGADGVADGDGAAVDVEAVLGDGELAADGDGLGGEGLVELEEADVLDLDAALAEGGAGG